MLKCNVFPADTYIVLNKTILTEQDRKIITMLYQPLIGGKSTSLYFTLWSYLDRLEVFSSEFTHHHLMTSLGYRMDEVIEAREKLEGVGLLKTYVKKDHINNFVYELYSPLSPKEFFENPILSTSLYHNIGKKEYENVLQNFKVPRINLKDYEDITCLFSEVFDMVSTDEYTYQKNLKRKQKGNIEIETFMNIDQLLEKIPEELLNIRSVGQELKDLLLKLAFVYHLEEDAMVQIIQNSLTAKRTIDPSLLRKNARDFYTFEHSGNLPSILYKNQPEYLRKPIGDTSKRAKIIYTFETTSPYAFLASKYKDGKPLPTELKILETLAIDLNLKPGVINVLVDYVLKINKNKLAKNFTLAIAAQWKKSKIETVEDAMNFAEKEYKSRRKDGKRVTVEEKPEWFSKTIKKQEMSKEELKEIDQLLEGI